MVARKAEANPRNGTSGGVVRGLVLTWRRWLTAVLRAAASVAARLAATGRTRGAAWVDSTWIIVVGVACLLIGVIGATWLADPGHARTLALVAGAESVVWAAVRWLIMRLTGRGSAARGRALAGAWAFGLVPYAIAVVPALSLAAWIVSAGVTWFGLLRMGDEPENAARTVGIAWGAQAAVVAASWMARAGIITFLALRA